MSHQPSRRRSRPVDSFLVQRDKLTMFGTSAPIHGASADSPILYVAFSAQDSIYRDVLLYELCVDRLPLVCPNDRVFALVGWEQIDVAVMFRGLPTLRRRISVLTSTGESADRATIAYRVCDTILSLLKSHLGIETDDPHELWTLSGRNGIRLNQFVIAGLACVEGVCVVEYGVKRRPL